MSVKRYKVWLEEAGGFVEVVRGTDYDAAERLLKQAAHDPFEGGSLTEAEWNEGWRALILGEPTT